MAPNAKRPDRRKAAGPFTREAGGMIWRSVGRPILTMLSRQLGPVLRRCYPSGGSVEGFREEEIHELRHRNTTTLSFMVERRDDRSRDGRHVVTCSFHQRYMPQNGEILRCNHHNRGEYQGKMPKRQHSGRLPELKSASFESPTVPEFSHKLRSIS